LLLAAVDAVVHLVRGGDGGRRISGIAVLGPAAAGQAEVRPAYGFTAGGVVRAVAASVLDRRLERS
jgi:hypothetical protein